MVLNLRLYVSQIAWVLSCDLPRVVIAVVDCLLSALGRSLNMILGALLLRLLHHDHLLLLGIFIVPRGILFASARVSI